MMKRLFWKELGNDGIINKTYENLRSINSFKTEDYIYVSLDISSIESHLLRINSETNSTFDFVSNEILIYPIPASQEIFVKGNENKSFVSYQLYDMLGHKVQDGSLVDNKVTLQQHNPGLYFMSLRSNEELVTKQIVIE